MANFAGAVETNLQYWLGTDNSWEFTIYTDPDDRTTIRDVTGYTTNFMVKRYLSDADGSALLTASGTVSGTFNSDPSVNTQVVTVTVADTSTDTEIVPGTAHWALKRTDDGSEKVLAFGMITMRRAPQIA